MTSGTPEALDQHIEKLVREIDKTKKLRDAKYASIKYNPVKPRTCTFQTPIMEDLYPQIELAEVDLADVTKEMLGLDKDYMRDKLKKEFRMAWRDPGYKNDEFNPVKPLRPQVLSEWEYIRCLMPERSYKYYPEKGHLKVSHQIREFGIPPKSSLGEKYAEYLEQFEKDSLDYKLRPSKHGSKSKAQVLLATVELNSKKEPFKLPATAPGREFGYNIQYKSTQPERQTSKSVGKQMKSLPGSTKTTELPKLQT